MLQSSKLSSRFKKFGQEETVNEQPKKFAFSKSSFSQSEPEVIQQENNQNESASNIEDVLKNTLTDKIDSIPVDRKSTRLNSSHDRQSRMPSSA